MPVDQTLPVARILRLADEHGARHVRVFGSRARGDATATSDLDLLVDLEPGRDLLDLIGLQQALEYALGMPVDVHTEGGLSRHVRGRVLAEARPLGAA